jgi:hypothetical protein
MASIKSLLVTLVLCNILVPSESHGANRWFTPSRLGLRGGRVINANSSSICGPCIGIDLGTTYSCVAVWKNGRVEVCPNDQGNRITPSFVAWDSEGQRIVGDAAKNQAASNPINTIFDVKRLIGRKFSDSTVQRDAKLLPFKSMFWIYHHSIANLLRSKASDGRQACR